MRRNIAYKVVLKRDGKFLSTNASCEFAGYKFPDCVKLEYGVGVTTVPQYGKLFVFKEFRQAIQYESGINYAIIKGYITNPTRGEKRLYSGFSTLGNCQNIKKFWDDLAANKKPDWYNVTLAPSYTVFCDNFTGLEVVKA